LLHAAAALLPETDKRGHLCEIHEGNIVNVSVSLSVQDNCRGKALVTHALREGLMVGALIVDLVTELGNRKAILTLLIRLMLPFALRFHFREESLKALVLHNFVILIT
jgi:hypothetical protein